MVAWPGALAPRPRSSQRLAVDNPLWEVARDGRADAFQRGFVR